MSELRLLDVGMPNGGADTRHLPQQMSPAFAPTLKNAMVDTDGKIRSRGPIVDLIGFNTVATDIGSVGRWVFDDKILIGRGAGHGGATGTAYRLPWEAPFRKVTTSSHLANGSTSAIVWTDSGLSTFTYTSVGHVPGPRWVRVGPYVYGIAFDTATAAVNENGGYLKLTGLVRWDGGTTAASTTLYANAPRGAQDITCHYNRLFMLGGRDPGALGQIEQNTLYYSDAFANNTALADTTAAWSDDTSGLINKIVIESDDLNDYGVALARAGGRLVIFKRNSIHVLYGYSPSTFSVKTITKRYGCVNPTTVKEYGDGVFFMSLDGMMYFDGSAVTPVDTNIKSVFSTYGSIVPNFGNSTTGYSASVVDMPNDYLWMQLASHSVGTSVFTATGGSSWYLHVPTGAWSQFTENINTVLGKRPAWIARTRSNVVVSDDQWSYTANRMFDIDPGVTMATAMNDVYNGTSFPIPFTVGFRHVELAGPIANKVQLHRVLVDHLDISTTAADTAEPALTVEVRDSVAGTVLVSQQLTTLQSGTSTTRIRKVIDSFIETDCVQVYIYRAGTSGTSNLTYKSEIHQVTLEYQVTRPRR